MSTTPPLRQTRPPQRASFTVWRRLGTPNLRKARTLVREAIERQLPKRPTMGGR